MIWSPTLSGLFVTVFLPPHFRIRATFLSALLCLLEAFLRLCAFHKPWIYLELEPPFYRHFYVYQNCYHMHYGPSNRAQGKYELHRKYEQNRWKGWRADFKSYSPITIMYQVCSIYRNRRLQRADVRWADPPMDAIFHWIILYMPVGSTTPIAIGDCKGPMADEPILLWTRYSIELYCICLSGPLLLSLSVIAKGRWPIWWTGCDIVWSHNLYARRVRIYCCNRRIGQWHKAEPPISDAPIYVEIYILILM